MSSGRAGKRTLFDDDDAHVADKLTTNAAYAKKYERKKRNEELALCLFLSISSPFFF